MGGIVFFNDESVGRGISGNLYTVFCSVGDFLLQWFGSYSTVVFFAVSYLLYCLQKLSSGVE